MPTDTGESETSDLQSAIIPNRWSEIAIEAYQGLSNLIDVANTANNIYNIGRSVVGTVSDTYDQVVQNGQLVFNSIYDTLFAPNLASPEILNGIMAKYPGLASHMRSADVINALIANETLNVRKWYTDGPEEWGVGLMSSLSRNFGTRSPTEYFCARGNENILERTANGIISWLRPGLNFRNISIGPGQVQMANTCELRQHERYGGNSQTVEGTLDVTGNANAIGGYLLRSMDRFTGRNFTNERGEQLTYFQHQAQNPLLTQARRDTFARMQQLWDEGTRVGGPEGLRLRELALIWSYNPGVGRSGSERIQREYLAHLNRT